MEATHPTLSRTLRLALAGCVPLLDPTRAYALVPGARGRINTVLFTTLFVFGALGAYAGSQAFLLVGWPGVCAVGLAFSALAVAETPRTPAPSSRLKAASRAYLSQGNAAIDADWNEF